MLELRNDWLTDRQVIVAENRADRPNELEHGSECRSERKEQQRAIDPSASTMSCPFCPGQEGQTPPAVCERLDEQGRWRVRVVPNKYPAFSPGDYDNFIEDSSATPAVGEHEVIIESARHISHTSELSPRELCEVLETYAERLHHWRSDGRYEYGLVFKNQGARAGASLTHLHSQLVVLPQVPSLVRAEFDRAEQHFKQHASCAYCERIAQERAAGKRIVLDRDGFVAFCPHASLQPYEVWLLPTQHEPWFEQQEKSKGMDQLATVLHAILRRIEAVVPKAAYNLILRTSPWTEGSEGKLPPHYHWRIEVLPRTTAFAGLELATGIHINQVAPEHAAFRLSHALE